MKCLRAGGAVAVGRMRCRGVSFLEVLCASNPFGSCRFFTHFQFLFLGHFFAIDTRCTLADGKHNINILHLHPVAHAIEASHAAFKYEFFDDEMIDLAAEDYFTYLLLKTLATYLRVQTILVHAHTTTGLQHNGSVGLG